MQNMFSSDFVGHSGEHTNNTTSTSYCFGAHTTRNGEYIFYELDEQVVLQDPKKIPIIPSSTPAWVLADLMLSAYRGQPLREYEELLLSQPFQSPGLIWLENSLCQLSK